MAVNVVFFELGNKHPRPSAGRCDLSWDWAVVAADNEWGACQAGKKHLYSKQYPMTCLVSDSKQDDCRVIHYLPVDRDSRISHGPPYTYHKSQITTPLRFAAETCSRPAAAGCSNLQGNWVGDCSTCTIWCSLTYLDIYLLTYLLPFPNTTHFLPPIS